MSDEKDKGVGKQEASENSDLGKKKEDFLTNLSAREAEVLRSRLGIDPSAQNTLEVVREQFEVTREKIRAIEEKALRRLKGNDNEDPDGKGPEAG
ncbi:MAG: sigma factor-like helix-turn-helix DNA-binding protein [Bacteroidota bacterium]